VRIASLTPEMAINSLYRSFVPMQELAHRGHSVHIEERNDVQDPTMLFKADVVHFMRFYHPAMVRLARRLKDAGVAIVWDNDDDLSVASPGRRDSPLLLQGVRSGIAAMVRCAHVVTTPSEMLADRYRRLDAADVRVLDNYLPPTFTRPERVMPHPGITIGWLAALEHQVDYERLGLRDTLERLLARHQHLEIISVGLGLGLRSRRYRHMPITLYGELPELLVHFDVGIAPLSDVPFNQGRSTIKVKEYSALGVPWLASPTGPYRSLSEEEGGRLVEDDAWYRELEQMILDADARSRLGRRARLWAQGETIEQHIDGWEAALTDAVERARAAHAVG
jgi:glycosyltransferase involved in cell wall biosynthesis